MPLCELYTLDASSIAKIFFQARNDFAGERTLILKNDKFIHTEKKILEGILNFRTNAGVSKLFSTNLKQAHACNNHF